MDGRTAEVLGATVMTTIEAQGLFLCFLVANQTKTCYYRNDMRLQVETDTVHTRNFKREQKNNTRMYLKHFFHIR